ncbi:hypothetical protein [Pseudomonas syringae]|uniref:hypothetical protein n=1 Tax=Pseudomonas syringae TaxID=317 RepID=UPI001480CEBE|nr:hypothetical protein [Pseudomonas syringae]
MSDQGQPHLMWLPFFLGGSFSKDADILVQFFTEKSANTATKVNYLFCQVSLLQDFSKKCTTTAQQPATRPKTAPCGVLSFLAMIASNPINFLIKVRRVALAP